MNDFIKLREEIAHFRLEATVANRLKTLKAIVHHEMN